jgi:hypothetical protein
MNNLAENKKQKIKNHADTPRGQDDPLRALFIV